MSKDVDQKLFGVPTTFEQSQVILMPVPWEVTTSYGDGASRGPDAILKASPQVDLFDVELGNAYELGYHLLPVDPWLFNNNLSLCELARGPEAVRRRLCARVVRARVALDDLREQIGRPRHQR